MEKKVHNCAEMVDYVQHVGMLPLLSLGISGWSADDVVSSECRYVRLPDGGWEWPLWKWKGQIIQESGCAYGKFFRGKAAFVSREWWPDFCNYRRSVRSKPEDGSIEDSILTILKENGSAITRDLRSQCGFTGEKMRSRFDAYLSRLEMGCYVVTEDFVYPHDRHGREYGWGWSLLTTPEELFGHDVCVTDRTPEESLSRLAGQIHKIVPWLPESEVLRLLRR